MSLGTFIVFLIVFSIVHIITGFEGAALFLLAIIAMNIMELNAKADKVEKGRRR